MKKQVEDTKLDGDYDKEKNKIISDAINEYTNFIFNISANVKPEPEKDIQ